MLNVVPRDVTKMAEKTPYVMETHLVGQVKISMKTEHGKMWETVKSSVEPGEYTVRANMSHWGIMN